MRDSVRRLGGSIVLSLTLVQLSACSWRAPSSRQPLTKPVEGGVKFSKVALAQADAKGKLLWKFQAEGVSYGETQQVVQAKSLKGQLFEAGRPIFDVAAEGGTVRQTNQQVRLRGNIRVVDLRHKTVFQGKEAQWDGKTGQLLVQKGLTVTDPKLQIWGNQLQSSQQGREVRITGRVVMETKGSGAQDERRVRLKTEQAVWQVEKQRIEAGLSSSENQPSVSIEQLGTPETSTALAGTAVANLEDGLITLRSPVKVQVGPITLTSRQLIWDTGSQKVMANDLLQILDPRYQLSVLANRGTLEQRTNIVDLQGKVEVKGLQNNAHLRAEQLIWNTSTQRIEATGNVHYAQTTSPYLTLNGPKAVGKITDQTLRLSGGDVVTEIIP